ncbi:hypothetical protein [Marinifilum flexuosum]|uniref:Uncharacterized protein n=1 Tax=Marinifilum flexuosum TaxID=1117708 RepID=A0A419XB64_9BACT|nr:hypothetical protein [Marinifilum flexuosum]RKE04820.1 hypothetical protein BXY64_1848 [Marinifilum flexuosum]
MKQSILTLLFLSLLFSINSFGQNAKFESVNAMQQSLINDLSSTFRDTSISFVISPLVTQPISFSDLDIPYLVEKYDFCEEQFIKKPIDTLLINSNKYFKLIEQDSLLKYNNLEFEVDTCLKKGIDPFQSPILYYVERYYNKGGICYFYKPVFSQNGSYAIVEYWTHCGFLCGWGELVLMRRIKQKWKIIETIVVSES